MMKHWLFPEGNFKLQECTGKQNVNTRELENVQSG